MVVLPALAIVGGFYWWLNSGRFISTDNAYVGADKALITPYITGPITAIHVKEGQHVGLGDALFDLDPAPYQHAVALWKGKVEASKIEYENSKDQYKSNVDQILMAKQLSIFTRPTTTASIGSPCRSPARSPTRTRRRWPLCRRSRSSPS